MSRSNSQILFAIISIALSVFASASDISREDASDLMEECQSQREESIAPLREQAIEDCVTKKRKDREYCESVNKTFGNARARKNGTMIPGMFWDLPVCEEAVAAEKHFKMNPSSRSYNLP